MKNYIVGTALLLCSALHADDYISLGGGNYMINNRVVITLPFGNGKYWDGGSATKVGNNWYGYGLETYPSGEASLTATMTEEPAQESYDSYQPYVVIPESPPEPEPIVGLIFPVWGPK